MTKERKTQLREYLERTVFVILFVIAMVVVFNGKNEKPKEKEVQAINKTEQKSIQIIENSYYAEIRTEASRITSLKIILAFLEKNDISSAKIEQVKNEIDKCRKNVLVNLDKELNAGIPEFDENQIKKIGIDKAIQNHLADLQYLMVRYPLSVQTNLQIKAKIIFLKRDYGSQIRDEEILTQIDELVELCDENMEIWE